MYATFHEHGSYLERGRPLMVLLVGVEGTAQLFGDFTSMTQLFSVKSDRDG